MEGRKESRYNLAGTCPECGKLIKVEHIIAVDIVEPGTTTKVEEKDNAETKGLAEKPSEPTESADVRPADTKGPAGTESSVPEPTDSGKSKTDKRSGGKTK